MTATPPRPEGAVPGRIVPGEVYSSGPVTPAVTVSREALTVDTAWYETGRVRIRRIVTTRTETVQVQLRREELHIENLDARTAHEPTDHQEPHEPTVIVLREEVLAPPVVTVRPYEKVTVDVDQIRKVVPVHAVRRHEEIDVHHDEPTA